MIRDNAFIPKLLSCVLKSVKHGVDSGAKGINLVIGEPWYSLTDTQRVHPWMLDRPVHGADGRLANHPDLPFRH
nr:hypothetical protein [uncultured Shewanella sp.]